MQCLIIIIIRKKNVDFSSCYCYRLFDQAFVFLSRVKVISHGMAARTQGISGVNPLSSRSHAMLQIQLKQPNQQMVGR